MLEIIVMVFIHSNQIYACDPFCLEFLTSAGYESDGPRTNVTSVVRLKEVASTAVCASMLSARVVLMGCCLRPKELPAMKMTADIVRGRAET